MKIAKLRIVLVGFMKMMTGGQLDIAMLAVSALRMNIESAKSGGVVIRNLNHELLR